MSKTVALGVIFLSILTTAVYFLLAKLDVLKNEKSAALAIVALLVCATIATHLLFKGRFKNVDPLMYVLSIIGCSGPLCFVIALEMDGFCPKIVSKLLTGVFPFLEKSAYFVMNYYWHSVVHFILAITMIGLYTRRESHREVGLYLAASLLNLALVIWPALITGNVKIPCLTAVALKGVGSIVLPLLVIGRFLHRRPVQARSFLKFDPLWKRPVDLAFFVYYSWTLKTSIFRGLAVAGGNMSIMKSYLKLYDPFLSEPFGFAKTQTVMDEYVNMMYCLFVLYGLVCPGQHWMADFSILHAGASAQGQFVYMLSSVHRQTAKEFRAPMAGQAAVIYWGIHLALFIVPHLFALWCQRDAEKFGRTYTMDLATPVRTYVVTSSRQTVTKKTE